MNYGFKIAAIIAALLCTLMIAGGVWLIIEAFITDESRWVAIVGVFMALTSSGLLALTAGLYDALDRD